MVLLEMKVMAHSAEPHGEASALVMRQSRRKRKTWTTAIIGVFEGKGKAGQNKQHRIGYLE